ncbi:uncharacterized protein [Arachis hypogaea]|uniref:uncharacterized protein n=1 Tax=Arachis hypogaea TaxID=3818 RepID=UPI003B212ABE
MVLLRLIISNPALVVVLLASLCVAVLLASHPASSIKYPPCYKDISFWIKESFTENILCELVRGIAGDLVEETDTASVLLKAIGYIRFLQSQIEALSLPYLSNGSGNTRHQQHSSFRDLHKHVKVTVLLIFWWLVIGEEDVNITNLKLLTSYCMKTA